MRGNRIGDFDTAELFRLWGRGVPQDEICATLGIRRGSFWAIRDRLKLPSRQCDKDRASEFRQPDDPTPEQIAERAAAVRAGWSEVETERRLVGRPRGRVELRHYDFDRQNFAFSGVDSYSA